MGYNMDQKWEYNFTKHNFIYRSLITMMDMGMQTTRMVEKGLGPTNVE
jgi:hypothetical protein